MRLNVTRYLDIVSKKGISPEYVQRAVGLSEKAYLWILENNSIECMTLELIADAIGSKVNEIALPDSFNSMENVIEWIKDGQQATLTLTQRRTITRVKELAKERPEECQIIAENQDGSICAHIPVSWVRINPSYILSEEERQRRSECMKSIRENAIDLLDN